jgi:DNA-binding transcriptional LysR family regulator
MDQLSQIATFVKVVEAGGFSAAARELGVAPSVVTAHVQSLEKRLGARLLNRNTRHVAATEAGIVYYRRCTDLLKRFEEAEEAIGSIQTTPTGSLRINASLLVPHLINPVISKYGAKYPEVSIRLTVTGQMVDLIDENYDLGIRHKVPPSPSVVVRKLAEYRFVVCGSPKYFKRRKAPTTPAELVGHNCLIYTDSGHGERWPIFEEREQIPLKGNLYSNDIVSLIEAAESGLGITVAPDFALEETVASGRLVPVLSDHTTRPFPITLMYPQRGSHPAKVRLFVDMLADHMRQSIPANRALSMVSTET